MGKTNYTLYNPNYHEAVRETTIAADDVSDESFKLSEYKKALSEAIKLMSHYAELLNMHDGGKRVIPGFTEWIRKVNNRV